MKNNYEFKFSLTDKYPEYTFLSLYSVTLLQVDGYEVLIKEKRDSKNV